MMKPIWPTLLALAGLAFALTSQAPPVRAQAPSPKITIPSTGHWDIKSKITGRTYRIFISQPVRGRSAPADGAAILYVLDGNISFSIARAAAWAAAAGWWDALGAQVKPALVVGIGYPTNDLDLISAMRGGDFVPHAAQVRDKAHRAEFSDADREPIDVPLPHGIPPGEGAEKFFRFIHEELQPRLAAKYGPLNTADTTLWGHSLGGLFVLNTLFTHPTAFRSYVISSPEMEFQHRRVLENEARFIRVVRSGQAKPRVLILSGANEGKPYPKDRPLPPGFPPGFTRDDIDKINATRRMHENPLELFARLSQVRGLTVQYQLFANEDHGSMVPASIGRAITFGL